MVEHPHPDKLHVLKTYRRYLLAVKRINGSARSLVHYREMVETYRTAKRQWLREGER